MEGITNNEGKESGPVIKFKIAYGSHGTSEDLEFLKGEFQECDIYVPENILGQGPKERAMTEALSFGAVTPEIAEEALVRNNPDYKNGPFYGFLSAQAKMLYGSKKEIIFIDTIADNDTDAETTSEEPAMPDLLSEKTLEGKIVVARKMITELITGQKEREEHMLAQIPVKIKELLARKPELAKKPELKVLISLGAGHTPLFHVMRKRNLAVKRFFPKLPYQFGLTFSAIRSVEFGLKKVEDLTEEMMAKIVLDLELFKYFSQSIKGAGGENYPNEFLEKAEKLISTLTLEEIKEFYKQRSRGKEFTDLFAKLPNKKI